MASAEWAAYAFDIYQSIVILLGWGIWYLPVWVFMVVGACEIAPDHGLCFRII